MSQEQYGWKKLIRHSIYIGIKLMRQLLQMRHDITDDETDITDDITDITDETYHLQRNKADEPYHEDMGKNY